MQPGPRHPCRRLVDRRPRPHAPGQARRSGPGRRTTEDDCFLVDVEAGYGPAVLTRLTRFKLRVKVEITSLDWTAVALRGPDASAVVDAQGLAVPFAWNGVVGVDLLGPAVAVPAGIRSCGADAWQSVRVEAGIPVMGSELDERTIAAEADLLERCVSFTKGCYTGQELVARLDARGNKVARRSARRGGRYVARRGAASQTGSGGVGGRQVGRAVSPPWHGHRRSARAVALAYIHRDVAPPSPVMVSTAGEQDAVGAVGGTVRVLPLLG